MAQKTCRKYFSAILVCLEEFYETETQFDAAL